MFNSEDVRLLQEAYASVYFDEAQYARENPEKYEYDERRKKSKKQRAMEDPHTGINSPAFHEFMRTQMGGGKKKKVKEEVFDEILSHLLDEGYADTEQAALAIMANMSEEWKQSIVEAVGIVGPPKRAIDAVPGVRNLRIGLANTVKRSDYPASYSSRDIPMAGKHVIPTERFPSKTTGKPTGYKDISGD